jgi:putative transposase
MTEGGGAFPQVGRKTPAGGAHIFIGQPNISFVTVNAKDRIPWIGQTGVQSTLVQLWQEKATAWLVGFYLLMPDHLHLFCAPRDLHFGIDQWITFWKRQFSRQHVDQDCDWQRRAFHHRVRDRIQYEEKLAYVRENPLRKGLLKTAEGWPLQGQVHDLRWAAD